MNNFKSILFNVFPTEDYIKEEAEQILEGKNLKGDLNIFYKIDLELLKIKKEQQAQQQTQPAPEGGQIPAIPAPEVTPVSTGSSAPIDISTPEQTPAPEGGEQTPENGEQQPENNEQNQDLKFAASSVVTEDVMIRTDKKVIIKSEEKIKLKENQISEIQSIEDVIDVISHRKSNGVKLFNDFTRDILMFLVDKKFNELKDIIDAKDSKIYVEIYYGKKKTDSVGFKAVKRQGSEDITLTVLIDDEIVSMPFDKNRLNRKIVEIRNYEVKK